MNIDELVEQAINKNKMVEEMGEDFIFAEADAALDMMLADTAAGVIPDELKATFPSLDLAQKSLEDLKFLNKERGRQAVKDIADKLKPVLCDTESALRKLLDQGVEWALAIIIPAIIAAVSSPLPAALVVAVAIYIYRIGFAIYCS
ncbi:hypothetical protein [Marinibacterium sp. SX1]|uniref:hypothetical protein n=1 Tax=Marinibacterium sp. SX1 TaxID=3388424 RepID=UPI003D16441E